MKPGMVGRQRGHAFISYVHEDTPRVDRLQRFLEDNGVPVWRDTRNLWPGEDWELKIREAIATQSLAFVACFSRNSQGRQKTYQSAELRIAIDQLRLLPPDAAYLMPVRFDNCSIPDFDLGGGKTLRSLNRADLFDESWSQEADRLLAGIRRILGPSEADRRPPSETLPSSGGAADGSTSAGTVNPARNRRFFGRYSPLPLAAISVAALVVVTLAALAPTLLSAPPAAPAAHGLPAPPPGHRVTDSTGAVSLIVPDSWGSFASEGWHPMDLPGIANGENIGPGLNASTNWQDWFNDLATPGLFAGASKLLVADHFTPQSILSELTPSAFCYFASQHPSAVGGLTGYSDTWTCGKTATRFETVALWPQDHQFIAFLEIKTVTPSDQASADRAVTSLTVHY
jgi:hypothetical protein